MGLFCVVGQARLLNASPCFKYVADGAVLVVLVRV